MPQGNGNDRVYGDIVTASSGSRNVFYKGFDFRLQEFWKDGSGVYHHNWIDNNWAHTNYTIKPSAGSMVLKNNYEIAYIGKDNKIHQYAWTSSGWTHTLLPYTYGGAGLGYPNGDYARNGIGWNVTNNMIVYGGFDGRVQYLKDTGGGNWSHWWVDDYWNTGIFNTFTSSSQFNRMDSDIKINSDNKIFYIGQNGFNLQYFNIEPCQEIETICWYNGSSQPYEVLKRNTTQKTTPANLVEDKEASFTLKVYPNPTNSNIFVELGDWMLEDNPSMLNIKNVSGQNLISQSITSKTTEVDLRDLPQGVYILQIIGDYQMVTEKIVKK